MNKITEPDPEYDVGIVAMGADGEIRKIHRRNVHTNRFEVTYDREKDSLEKL